MEAVLSSDEQRAATAAAAKEMPVIIQPSPIDSNMGKLNWQDDDDEVVPDFPVSERHNGARRML